MNEVPDVVQIVVPATLIPYLKDCLTAATIDLYGPVPLPGVEDDLPTYLTRPLRFREGNSDA
jgi:hypothetical protein